MQLEILGSNEVGGYFAVWKPWTGKAWQKEFGLNINEYQSKIEELKSNDFKLTSVRGYSDDGVAKFAAIWEENDNGADWMTRHDMSLNDLEQHTTTHGLNGFHLTHVNSYKHGDDLRYAAIWEKDATKLYFEGEKTSLGFSNVNDNYAYTGFSLKQITGASRNGSSVFLGVWRNDGGWQSQDLDNIKSIVYQYMHDYGVPGASLSVVKGWKTCLRFRVWKHGSLQE